MIRFPYVAHLLLPAGTAQKNVAQPDTKRETPSSLRESREARDIEVSLIIPAHNEEERLLSTLFAYSEALYGRFSTRFEIVVVANGCVDQTVELANNVAASLPQVRTIEIEGPVGKGGSVLEGFRQVRGGNILFADADGATVPESLIDLLEQLDYHDVVIGSRRLNNSAILQRQPLMRRICGQVFKTTVHLAFGLPFYDTQCGAKAFRRHAASRLAEVVTEKRWAFDVDLLLSAKLLGLDVHEQPVVWAHHSGSQLRFAPTAYQVIRSLWQMKHQYGWLRKHPVEECWRRKHLDITSIWQRSHLRPPVRQGSAEIQTLG
jgi:glycosyltransferase involved in cell wall biosynthesis